MYNAHFVAQNFFFVQPWRVLYTKGMKAYIFKLYSLQKKAWGMDVCYTPNAYYTWSTMVIHFIANEYTGNCLIINNYLRPKNKIPVFLLIFLKENRVGTRVTWWVPPVE